MDHITIVVVHFNQTEYTNQCLDSLAKVKHPNLRMHVLIVDNGSVKPYRLPKKVSKSTFVLIRSDANLGFTGGNNLGIHTAIERFNSDYILLLNNDTTVDPLFLVALHQQLQEKTELGMTAPLIYFSPGREFHKSSYKLSERGQVIWYAGGSIDWQHVVAFHRGVDEIDRGQFTTQTTSDFATGCCVLIKREVLEKIGFLDKRFFMYGEDVDFCLRARSVGYGIGFCAQAKIWHANAGSSGGSGSKLHVYYQERNRYLLAWRYGNWKVWISLLRLQVQAIFSHIPEKQLAVVDFYRRRFGKVPLHWLS